MSKDKIATLYALLIAIDKYPIPRHRLNGCVNDRNAFKEYLERKFPKGHEEIDLKIKTLTDSEATKAGVIEAFKHFKDAKKGDICVFFFGGHGSQSPAPKEFWHLDPSQMNESMVCYDSRIRGGKDLMDKEISHLIWEATGKKSEKPHFVTVFDCCHSGTISRVLDDNVKSRMAEPAHVPSKLSDYYGWKNYKKNSDGTEYSPMVGDYIQLGACKAQETAKELRINGRPRGIFTYNLINALEQKGGQISYEDLIHTLKVRIQNKVRKQTPQLLSTSTNYKKLAFLGGMIDQKTTTSYKVDFHKGKWKINAGQVQGIPRGGGVLTLEDKTEVTISEVGINESIVEGMAGKDIKQSYRAFIKEMHTPKIKLAFTKESDATAQENFKKVIVDSATNLIELVAMDDDPQYWVHAIENTFRLTMPDDDRPLFRRVEGYDELSAGVFLTDAEKVARWCNLLNLDNPRTTLRKSDIEIQLFRTTEPGNTNDDDCPDEQVNWEEDPVFRYGLDTGGEWRYPAYKCKVINRSKQPLYVSMVNLLDDFGMKNKLMVKAELPANGGEAWLLDLYKGHEYRTIPLGVSEAYHSWGVTEKKEYLKFIISTDPDLDTNSYNQDGLKLDVNPAPLSPRGGREEVLGPPAHDWMTQIIPLTVVRPMQRQSLAAGRTVELMNKVSIKSPEGLQAEVCLNTTVESERSVMQGAEPLMLPGNLWGSNVQTGNYQITTQDYEITRGMNDSPGLSVLELSQIKGGDSISSNSPLIVDLNQKMEEGEFVMPMGYDPETKMYYPLGISNEKGEVIIETLPDPSPTNVINDRSVLGSAKIFLQKVVFSKLGFEYKHPQLALAKFGEGEEFEYLTDKETIKAAVDSSNKKIALFIHGIIGDTLEMTKSYRRAKNQEGKGIDSIYDVVLTFDYENLNTEIQTTAGDLKKLLGEIGLDEEHGKTLHIIAHSMGGLVSRHMIEKIPGGNKVVQHLIQLGTPNAGSPWSDVYELASVLLGRAVNGAAFLKPYIIPLSFLGKFVKKLFITLQQMDPADSTFLKKLNDGTDPGIPYTIVAGNTQLIPNQSDQEGLIKKLLQRFKNRGHYDALDLLLFKKPNDIAVAVDSIYGIKDLDARKNVTKQITVGCDHISYFGDPNGLDGLAEAVFNI